MKPIIFSTEMVCAILAGRKTQTRRVIKPQPDFDTPHKHGWYAPAILMTLEAARYRIGDILWVREAWREAQDGYTGQSYGGYWYKADSVTANLTDEYNPWRSPIYMPREAARIFLRVTDVRVERVQEIGDDDAIAEGCEGEVAYDTGDGLIYWAVAPTERYAELWDKLNAKRDAGQYIWARNPWVWVFEFERVAEPDKDAQKL